MMHHKAAILSLVLSLAYFQLAVSAEDLTSMLADYHASLQGVKTFIGTGTITIEISSSENANKSQKTTSQIAMYMKYPNLFKLVLSGAASSTVIQKGDLLSQKMPGSDSYTTSKVTRTGDLYRKFFGYEESSWLKDAQVLDQQGVDDATGKLVMFSVKPAAASGDDAQAVQGKGQAIDTIDLYFNANHLLVRSVSKSANVPLLTSEYSYEKIKDIWVTKSIATKTNVGKAQIVNTISYSSISVNTDMSDHIFDVK